MTYFTDGVRIFLEKQLGPVGPITSREGSVPVIQLKLIATFDFPGGGEDGPTVPSGYTHANNLF